MPPIPPLGPPPSPFIQITTLGHTLVALDSIGVVWIYLRERTPNNSPPFEEGWSKWNMTRLIDVVSS